MPKDTPQGKFWMLTIPKLEWDIPKELPDSVQYLKGQLEVGEGGFMHWQAVACFKKKVRLRGVKEVFGRQCHAELTKSKAANEYVHKDETAFEPDLNRFELGRLPLQRNNEDHWKKIKEDAVAGRLNEIDPQIFVCHYSSLKKIAMDSMKPTAMERSTKVFWGATGTGKSRKAWAEAGMDAYPKIPSTKFWDGYQGNEKVVMDEFTGQISIEHLLRWLDRYPVCVETKGAGTVLKATKFWITSNVDPRNWYPNAPLAQQKALMRRLDITFFPELVNDRFKLCLNCDTLLPETQAICTTCDERLIK